MQIAKVIRNGRSQSIGLPKEFRVDVNEVYLKKMPVGFLVMTRNPWELYFEGVAELSDDFMASGRQQQKLEQRKWKP